jgi:ribosome modulation factor
MAKAPRKATKKKTTRKKTAPAANGPVPHDHNSQRPEEMTDEQRQALFFNHQKAYAKALAEKKEADADFKNTCKLIKAEGSKISDIKLSLLEPEKFEAQVRDEVESFQRVARWVGSPLGTQLSLIDEPDRTPGDERAFEDGKRAGMKGEDCKAPFANHLPQANKWREGWHAGQAVVTASFKQAPDRGSNDGWLDEGEQQQEVVH